MNYNHIKAFYLVTKLGNISKAAKILEVTQPALSKIISTLEKELGIKLFNRNKVGVTLTKEGKNFFETIKNPYAELEKIEKSLINKTNLNNVIVHIGATSMAMECFLFRHLEELKNKFPNITFRIYTNNSGEILKMVENKILDFAFITTPYDISNEVEVIHVQELENVLIAPSSYKDKIKDITSIKQLSKFPFILLNNETTFRQQINTFFSRHSVSIKPAYEPDSSSLLLQFVENDCGLTFIPKGMIINSLEKEKIIELNIKENLDPRYISFLMLKDKSHLSVIDDIKNEIIKYKALS